MTREEMIEQLENTILLIKQNGKDWWDERDIPILEEAIKVMQKENTICEEVKQKTDILNTVNEALSKYGLTIAMYNFEGEGGFIELYIDKLIGS